MMRLLFMVSGFALLAGTAAAGPNGYRCAPGSPVKGVGCKCPDGYAPAVDDEIAICAVKRRPPPPPPDLPPPPPPQARLATTPVRIALDRFRAPAATPALTKPALDGDAALSIEGLVGQIRPEQEQILIGLIDNTPDSEVEEKSDYLFRLGELYAKQQRYWRIKAAEAAIASDGANDPQKAKLKQDSVSAANKAKDYLLKAVKTYKQLTQNDAFRNYPKMDMALFYYGYTMQSGKYMKEARLVYDVLLKNYPNSKYVPEAHLAFADYYFDAGQLADAEARYKQVLKFPKSSAYWYAMYRMGWIHLQLQRYQEALEVFFQVAQATRNDAKQSALHLQSKRDFARAYAPIGKPDKAYAAFARVDAQATGDLLDVLAGSYLAAGTPEKAAVAYQVAVSSAPGNAAACGWQLGAARATLIAAAARGDLAKTIDVCPADVDQIQRFATGQ